MSSGSVAELGEVVFANELMTAVACSVLALGTGLAREDFVLGTEGGCQAFRSEVEFAPEGRDADGKDPEGALVCFGRFLRIAEDLP